MRNIKLNELVGAVLGEEKKAVNGARYKEVKVGNGVIGCVFANKIGVDQNGQDVYESSYNGNVKIILDKPLALGKVSVLGKVYNMIEKIIEKKDGDNFKRNVLIDADGNEAGIYGKAFIKKKNGQYKFFDNRWMVRFNLEV
jgi:hypothetical protein